MSDDGCPIPPTISDPTPFLSFLAGYSFNFGQLSVIENPCPPDAFPQFFSSVNLAYRKEI